MLDLTRCEGAPTDLMRRVTTRLLELAPTLRAQDVMLIGAGCRDLLQTALGHEEPLRATQDIDVALALADWQIFHELRNRLKPTDGTTDGMRFHVAGAPVDLVPFGTVESPAGVVTPHQGREGMSVWAFREVFEHSMELPLTDEIVVRLPSVPGYAALKLCAWLDRVPRFEYKDASDIASVLRWYSESDSVLERLYDFERDASILVANGTDAGVASAQLLGSDVVTVIGPERQLELEQRWPDRQQDALVREMKLPQALSWTSSPERRREILNGLERGLFSGPPDPAAAPGNS